MLSLPIAYVTALSLVAVMAAELSSKSTPQPSRLRRVLISLVLLTCLVAAPFLAAATGDCHRWLVNGRSEGCLHHSGSYLDWNFWLWGSANWGVAGASYAAARVMNWAERLRSDPGRLTLASDPRSGRLAQG